jgi:hypothetical protein
VTRGVETVADFRPARHKLRVRHANRRATLRIVKSKTLFAEARIG